MVFVVVTDNFDPGMVVSHEIAAMSGGSTPPFASISAWVYGVIDWFTPAAGIDSVAEPNCHGGLGVGVGVADRVGVGVSMGVGEAVGVATAMDGDPSAP